MIYRTHHPNALMVETADVQNYEVGQRIMLTPKRAVWWKPWTWQRLLRLKSMTLEIVSVNRRLGIITFDKPIPRE